MISKNKAYRLGCWAAAAMLVAAGAASAQVDHPVPLNYNWHAMARPGEAIFGSTAMNGDSSENLFRSFADRGFYFSTTDPNSIGGTPLIGVTGITYGLFNTLGYSNTTWPNAATNGLDSVVVANRVLNATLEILPGNNSNSGPFPPWSPAFGVSSFSASTGLAATSPGVITATTASAHGFRAGDTVLVGGAIPTVFNGTYTILATPDATHFTYLDPTGNVGGTAQMYANNVSVSSTSLAGTTLTVNCATAHGLTAGQSVALSGMNIAAGPNSVGYNGTFPVLSVTAGTPSTVFTVNVGAAAGSGTARMFYNAGAGQFQISGLTTNTTTVTATAAASATTTPTGLAGDGTTVTASFSAAHPFSVGQRILITGATPAGFNGTYVIASVPTTATLTFASAATGPSTVAGVCTEVHGLTSGQSVTISGVNPIALNGTYTVAVPSATVSSIVSTTTTATATTSAANPFSNGQSVTISGASVAAHNGTFPITVPAATIAYLAGNGTTVTATTAAAHAFVSGQLVSIAGSYPAAYNGTYTVTVPDSTHFTFASAVSAPFTGASTGVTATSANIFTYAIPTTSGTSSGGGMNATTPSVFTYSLAPLGTMLVKPATGFTGFGYALSSLQGNGAAVTGQTANAHNLVLGQSITISNVTPASYNGTFIVTAVPTTTTFIYADTNTAATTGTFMGAGTLDRASTDQVTTLSTPQAVDATTQIGVLYTVSNGPNIPFDCVLTFNNGGGDVNVTARFTPPDWYGSGSGRPNAADQGILAGQPIASQTKVLHPFVSSVIALQGNGTTVTADTAVPQGFIAGDSVTITGNTGAPYNGTYTVASVGTATAAIGTGGLSGDGTTVTATTGANAYVTGQAVYISGVFPFSFNGVYIINVIDPTHFTFANPTVGTNTTGGSAVRAFFTFASATTGMSAGNIIAAKSTGTKDTFRGVQNTEGTQLQTFNYSVTDSGPNLNLTEGIIGLNAGFNGQQLRKITFRNATWTNFTISSGITVNGIYATATTTAAHGLIPGQTINITGVTPASFNGVYQVASVPTTTTFTFVYAGGASSTTTGTLQRVGAGRGYSIYAVTTRTNIPPPANGTPATAAVATAGTGTAGDNAGTVAAAFDGFTTTTGGGVDSYGVWYRYTAAGTDPHMAEARTCLDGQNATFAPLPQVTGVTGVRTVSQTDTSIILPLDTTIAVYSGPAAAPVFIAGNDDGCSVSSRVQWMATPGVEYLIRVASKAPAAGNASLFILHVDDLVHTDLTIPLQFNWNGICHGTAASAGPDFFSEQCVATPQVHENRTDLNGFRSISDRALLFDPNHSTKNAFNYGGTIGYQGISYDLYDAPLQSDEIHLGVARTSQNPTFSPTTTLFPDPTSTAPNRQGYLPLWLPGDVASGTPFYDHGSAASNVSGLGAVFGDNTQIGLIYHMSNLATITGSMQMTLAFADGASFPVTIQSTDWFGGNDANPYNAVLPAVTQPGVAVQRILGIYSAVQNVDFADAAPGGPLKVDESVVTTTALLAAGFDPRTHGVLTGITFGNVVGNTTTNAAIYAATIRDPASFNLNFGPGGTGTVTPNMLTVGANGLMTVRVSRGSGAPNNITDVTVDASSIGLSSTFALNDSHTNGDVNANDNIWSANIGFPVNATPGALSLPFTVTDAQDRTATGNIIFTLVGPTGSATPNPVNVGQVTLMRVVLSPTTGGPADIAAVTVNGTALGLSAAIPLNDLGAGGDATNHDGTWSTNITVPAGAFGGVYALPVTITDISSRTATGSIGLTVVGPPVATDLGTLAMGAVQQSVFLDTNAHVQWIKFTLAAPIDIAQSTFLDIDTEGSNLGPANDATLGLYDSNGAFLLSDNDSGSLLMSQLTWGVACPPRPAVGDGLAYNGRNGATLAAGTYYLAVSAVATTYGGTNWNVTSTSANVGTVSLNINKGMISATGGVPAATNLGNVAATATPQVVNGDGNITAGGVAWFKFTLTADVNGAITTLQYIDLDTEGSAVSDTIMALFRDDGSGTLVVSDDDDGSGTFSQISMGRGNRPAVGDGVAYNGRDGALLTAGTYYVAVAERPAGFCNNFIVALTTGTSSGNVKLNIRAGTQSPIVGGPVHNPDNNHDYYMLTNGFTWLQAEAFAVNTLHGHLAQIQDQAENDFIFFNVIPFDGFNHDAFIGLWDPTSSTVVPATPAADVRPWTWIDGTSAPFFNWAGGEPNNGPASIFIGQEHYSDMRGASGQWNDISNTGNATDIIYAVVEVGAAGTCCRGSTCNATVAQADCAVTGGARAGASFVNAATACNAAVISNTPCCYANYNKVNGVSVQDIFDFLSDWFAGSSYAKVGGDGVTGTPNVQNIFDFLSNWFAGGCS